MQAIKSQHREIFRGIFCLILLFTIYRSAFGQAQPKRMLTTKDYSLWSQLSPGQISKNGNWVSYSLYYKHTQKDTLFLQRVSGNKKYVFPLGTKGKFNGESDFAYISRDTLVVQNLKTGTLYKKAGVTDFEFSANEKFLMIFANQSNGKPGLEIRDRTNKVLQNSVDITSYRLDPAQNGIVYSTAGNSDNSLQMMLFNESIEKRTIIENLNGPVQNLIWKGNTIAFIEHVATEPVLFNYDIIKHKISSLNPKNVKGFPADMKVSNARFKYPIISKDGSRVFFWLKEPKSKSNVIDPAAVQIWNTKDKQLFASKKQFGDYRMSDKLVVWDLKENSLFQLTDKDLPSGFLSADYNYAFIYDNYAYEPQSQQHSAYDLHLVDLKNGGKKRIIEKYVFGENIPSRSPDGRYLCYAKQGNWWIYDIQQDLHTNITLGMSNSFFTEDTNRPGEDEPYGVGGWTKDGEVILYDRYDLWKISLDGKVNTRLTKGRETQKSFRIKFFFTAINGNTEAQMPNLDLDKGFLLTTINRETRASGVSYWSLKSDLKELIWENRKIEQLSKARNKDTYMYVDQNFTSAPRLMVYDGIPKQIMQSNTQQENFYWGKNQRIEYIVDGKKAKGALFYPAAYNPDLKYPMVVQVYERQFPYFNDYENPTLISEVGFNVTNFTAQGYFVLYPDINYEYGNLRESVTKSVLAAVDTALGKANIDPFKVGLIGSSFGGYETDLIITETNRFAAAVAGMAWTDVVSAYLYVGDMFKRPDFFRTENHQLRIGKSLFEDMPAYLKNSPVLMADKVNTPLLGWAGEDDRHVNTSHSMEFYLALRRANKEHTLLVYPGEEHGLEKKENGIDLSVRIMQWFDYYLKGGKKQDWMKSN